MRNQPESSKLRAEITRILGNIKATRRRTRVLATASTDESVAVICMPIEKERRAERIHAAILKHGAAYHAPIVSSHLARSTRARETAESSRLHLDTQTSLSPDGLNRGGLIIYPAAREEQIELVVAFTGMDFFRVASSWHQVSRLTRRVPFPRFLEIKYLYLTDSVLPRTLTRLLLSATVSPGAPINLDAHPSTLSDILIQVGQSLRCCLVPPMPSRSLIFHSVR